MAYRTQCGSRVTFLGDVAVSMTRIHQICACIRDLLRLICYIYITAWITWLILMDLHQIFRFLDSCPNQQETRMILFSNVFKKSDLLVEPDCLNRIFSVTPTGLLVFQVISDVHPWDTLEQRAHRRHMAEKKVGRTCCFDFRSRSLFWPWRLRGMWEMKFHSILLKSWLPLTSSWKK